MITKIIDSFVYFTGITTIGTLIIFWDKKLTINNKVMYKSWISANNISENKTIIYFKYGVIPDYVTLYEKEEKKDEWKTIKQESLDFTKLFNYINFKNLTLNLNLFDSEVKNSSYFEHIKRI